MSLEQRGGEVKGAEGPLTPPFSEIAFADAPVVAGG
jgi:hypothetical protein